jgi:hypothetical protein
MLSVPVTGAQFISGVHVAAIDVDASKGGDDVVLAPAHGTASAGTVLDFSPIRASLFGSTSTTPAPSSTPSVVYQLPGAASGEFVAASNSVSESTPAVGSAMVLSTASSGTTSRA